MADTCSLTVSSDSRRRWAMDMQQEATDELIGRECHRLAHGLLSVVLPAERDVVAVEAHQAVIGDRDPMRVAAQIVEHLPGAAEGRFRVEGGYAARPSRPVGDCAKMVANSLTPALRIEIRAM